MGKKVIVSHGLYGCDTGCCGHYVHFEDEEVWEASTERFQFGHPYAYSHQSEEEKEQVYREYAEEMVRDLLGEEHVKDLDWENCTIIDD